MAWERSLVAEELYRTVYFLSNYLHACVEGEEISYKMWHVSIDQIYFSLESCTLHCLLFSSSVTLWRIQWMSSFSIKVSSSPIMLRKSHLSQQYLVLCLWEFMASGHYLHFLVFGKYPYVSRYRKSFTIYWELFIALLISEFNTLVIPLDGNNLHFTMFR